MKKITSINIPIVVNYDTEVEIAAKLFTDILERELLAPELLGEIESVVEKAKLRAQKRVNALAP